METFENLFDNNQCETFTDCDGNTVVTGFKWTVANAFDLYIRLDECPYNGYERTCMYLDNKEVYSWEWIATPAFLNNILIECICDVETEEISVEDTL